MTPPPLVSVVIPAWNSAAFLERCLASLAAQGFEDFETIVVDNASDDNSVELVRESFPEVALVRLERNRGFAGGVNAGASAARGRYLAILNSDTEVEPDWLGELVACVERHPSAASVASKVLRLDDRRVIDGVGDSMTWSLKAYRRGSGEPDTGQYEREDEVFSASGTACLWRADAFRRFEGFDESFFAYYEDVDLGFRARLAGYECWYAPRAVAGHAGRGASQRRWREFDSLHSVRNRWATVVKDAPAPWLLQNGHRMLAGELLTVARSLAVGDIGLLLRAYGQAVRSLPTWWAGRRGIQAQKTVPYSAFRSVVRRSFPPAHMSIGRLREARA